MHNILIGYDTYATIILFLIILYNKYQVISDYSKKIWNPEIFTDNSAAISILL